MPPVNQTLIVEEAGLRRTIASDSGLTYSSSIQHSESSRRPSSLHSYHRTAGSRPLLSVQADICSSSLAGQRRSASWLSLSVRYVSNAQRWSPWVGESGTFDAGESAAMM